MRASLLSLPRPRSREVGRRALRLTLALSGAAAGALLVVRTASAIDATQWELLLNPKSFRAAFSIMLASVALALGAFGLLAWAGPRRRHWSGRVAIVAATLVLLTLAVYWLSRPFATGAI